MGLFSSMEKLSHLLHVKKRLTVRAIGRRKKNKAKGPIALCTEPLYVCLTPHISTIPSALKTLVQFLCVTEYVSGLLGWRWKGGTYLSSWTGKVCLERLPVKISAWQHASSQLLCYTEHAGLSLSKMCPPPRAFRETWAEPAFFLRLLSDFQNVLVLLTHPKLCCLLFSILTSYLFKYISISLCYCGGV